MAIDFSLNELLSEQKCYQLLVDVLHPDGLSCPNGHSLESCFVHKSDRLPLVDYCCRLCGRYFNAFSNTVLSGTRYSVVQLIQLLRGIVQGVPTARLAREMGVDRKWVLVWRHKLQGLAEKARPKGPLPDAIVESDELYQNAGEKRTATSRSR